MRNYYPGITVFKLAGALAVLLAHVLFFRYASALPTEWNGLQFLFLLLRVIVPCFYMVSGFLAYQGWTHASDSGAYVRRYLKRIGLVYGFFVLLFIGQHTVPDLLRQGVSPGNALLQAKILFMAVFLNGPFLQLWFIPPLLAAVAAVYALARKERLKQAVWLAAAGFALCQFVTGTLRPLWGEGMGAGLLNADQREYAELFLTRYLGFGFIFVLAGVLVARHEAAFRAVRLRTLALPALAVSAVELALLLRYEQWTLDYKLAFSLLPNTVLLFYGVLRIRSVKIRAHHRTINRFSIVTFCGHIPFMQLNLLLFGWREASMGRAQDLIYLSLTFLECAAATALFGLGKRGEKAAPDRFAPVPDAGLRLAAESGLPTERASG